MYPQGCGGSSPFFGTINFSLLQSQAGSTRWYFLSQLPVDYLVRAAEADADHGLDWRESRLADPTRLTASVKVNKRQTLATVPCIDDARGVSVVRVLVVEDFEPFRRSFVRNWGKTRNCWSSAKRSDGLEAVRKAGELQPDLVLLDIGLPKLNGIEAGQQLRKLAPNPK